MRSRSINKPGRTPLRAALLAGATVLALAAGSGAAMANPIFTTPSGSTVSNSTNTSTYNVYASAGFNIIGDTLTITLTNTSPDGTVFAPTNVLTGISFLLNGSNPSLTVGSAISPNAIVNPTGCDVHSCGGTSVDVGGEWGYKSNYSGSEGIASSGYLDASVQATRFGATDLQSPTALDGAGFGIISNNNGSLNGGLSGGHNSLPVPLIQNNVDLTLTGVSGYSNSDIGSVAFFYGTAPDGTIDGTCTAGCGGVPVGPPSVPEPGSLALLGTGLIGLGLVMRRRRRG